MYTSSAVNNSNYGQAPNLNISDDVQQQAFLEERQRANTWKLDNLLLKSERLYRSAALLFQNGESTLELLTLYSE
jgi:hypothetical protein